MSKTIELTWQNWKSACLEIDGIGDALPEDMISFLRDAFYCGALALVSLINDGANPDDLLNELKAKNDENRAAGLLSEDESNSPEKKKFPIGMFGSSRSITG